MVPSSVKLRSKGSSDAILEISADHELSRAMTVTTAIGSSVRIRSAQALGGDLAILTPDRLELHSLVVPQVGVVCGQYAEMRLVNLAGATQPLWPSL